MKICANCNNFYPGGEVTPLFCRGKEFMNAHLKYSCSSCAPIVLDLRHLRWRILEWLKGTGTLVELYNEHIEIRLDSHWVVVDRCGYIDTERGPQ